jgi:creatinine amidohydrolase/Fe(II)-dependent formamide hydrolase-like protein
MPFLKNLKTTEVEGYQTAIVPMGATEQHGPFLPLGTDSVIMEGIVQEIDKLSSEIVILPNIEITCSAEHRGFAGTVWVSTATFKQYLREVIGSLSETFSEVFLITAHGGNVGVLQELEEEGEIEGIRVNFIHLENDILSDILYKYLNGPIDEHAGNYEISTVYYLKSEVVKLPPSDYPKTKIDMDWSKDKGVITQSKDGIVDNHSEWVISKEMAQEFLQAAAWYILETVESRGQNHKNVK